MAMFTRRRAWIIPRYASDLTVAEAAPLRRPCAKGIIITAPYPGQICLLCNFGHGPGGARG